LTLLNILFNFAFHVWPVIPFPYFANGTFHSSVEPYRYMIVLVPDGLFSFFIHYKLPFYSVTPVTGDNWLMRLRTSAFVLATPLLNTIS
jgi:hypothetical protein